MYRYYRIQAVEMHDTWSHWRAGTWSQRGGGGFLISAKKCAVRERRRVCIKDTPGKVVRGSRGEETGATPLGAIGGLGEGLAYTQQRSR